MLQWSKLKHATLRYTQGVLHCSTLSLVHWFTPRPTTQVHTQVNCTGIHSGMILRVTLNGARLERTQACTTGTHLGVLCWSIFRHATLDSTQACHTQACCDTLKCGELEHNHACFTGIHSGKHWIALWHATLEHTLACDTGIQSSVLQWSTLRHATLGYMYSGTELLAVISMLMLQWCAGF
jgi:hypothetical protein